MTVISTDDFLEHHGVKGMRWGVRRNTLAISKSDAADNPNKIRRAERKGKVVVTADTKDAAKQKATSVETLIRANAKVSLKEAGIAMDKSAHNAAVGAMMASYIRDGVKTTKAQSKALKVTKDAKARRGFEKRSEKLDSFQRKLNDRMKMKFSEEEMRNARKIVADSQRKQQEG